MESKIKEARKAAGLTQQAMSEKLNIPKRTIENWESGVNSCPEWAEKLIVEKLEEMKMEAKYYRKGFDKRLGGTFYDIYSEDLKMITVLHGEGADIEGLAQIYKRDDIVSSLKKTKPIGKGFVIAVENYDMTDEQIRNVDKNILK